MSALVTLTSDFGLRDPYVASMKGILCGMCPGVLVVDLSHDITPQSILEGALFLAGAAPYFPPGTIHVAVIDPGVGTERRPIVARAADQTFVCPDNGLLTMIERDQTLDEVREITNPDFMLDKVSPTFHGRDVFAPTAARLAAGAAMAEVGGLVDGIVHLDIPQPVQSPDGNLEGAIIHQDRFGNLITNIHRTQMPTQHPNAIMVGKTVIAGVKRTYADVGKGEILALFGSSDHLEIAVNQGNAAGLLGLGVGESVHVLV